MKKTNNQEYKYIENMLINYRKNIAMIKNLELEIEEMKNDYKGCEGLIYSQKSCHTYKISNPVLKEVEHREEKLEKLMRIKRSKEIEKEKVDNLLSVLNEDEEKLIKLRYFKELPFKEIANVVCKSEVYIIGLRKKIIQDKLVPLIH